MPPIFVSATKEILERFRLDLIHELRTKGLRVLPDVDIPGNCFDAVVAWQRLEHRRLLARSRQVEESPELRARQLDPTSQRAVNEIRCEFERGADMTQRLSRNFYGWGFNDFLFNNFGIHHLHLGTPLAGLDRTRKHQMSGGTSALLFVIVTSTEAYFLDVLDHQAFDDVGMAKSLARIALRNRSDLLRNYIAAGVLRAELTFEDAFRTAKGGFGSAYELDGTFLLTGGTVLDGRAVDGTRKPCTSTDVIAAANYTLSLIVGLIEYVQAHARSLAQLVESETRVRPARFNLSVVRAGPVAVLRDEDTGAEFISDGHSLGYRPPNSIQVRPLP